ncbi:hypothetical protein ACTXT7_012567 [Hymenolepis weldensis]
MGCSNCNEDFSTRLNSSLKFNKCQHAANNSIRQDPVLWPQTEILQTRLYVNFADPRLNNRRVDYRRPLLRMTRRNLHQSTLRNSVSNDQLNTPKPLFITPSRMDRPKCSPICQGKAYKKLKVRARGKRKKFIAEVLMGRKVRTVHEAMLLKKTLPDKWRYSRKSCFAVNTHFYIRDYRLGRQWKAAIITIWHGSVIYDAEVVPMRAVKSKKKPFLLLVDPSSRAYG